MGVKAAQLIHAAGESSPGNVKTGTYAVALVAPKEELEKLKSRLEAANICFKTICEPDAPYNGEIVAIGIAPYKKSKIRRLVSQLPLLKDTS